MTWTFLESQCRVAHLQSSNFKDLRDMDVFDPTYEGNQNLVRIIIAIIKVKSALPSLSPRSVGWRVKTYLLLVTHTNNIRSGDMMCTIFWYWLLILIYEVSEVFQIRAGGLL